ncbi:hypothetical protein ABE438_06335 [Bosea sp. TWI1241]|uniref:hypothetical protein n=1 Tax=Bosea sp. TWI1241 TaxID=3148904 RepID=UPI003207F800
MRLGLFGRKGRDPAEAERVEAARRQVRALLALPEDTAVAVNEIVCADPACPGTETVILVMEPGRKTRAYKVLAPLAELTPELLAQALRDAC